MYAQVEFADMYTERNVAISGIHTHSGPGGYLQYVLYDITSLGFVEQSWEAVVSGIVEVCFPGSQSAALLCPSAPSQPDLLAQNDAPAL